MLPKTAQRKQAIPVLCALCTSKTQPAGRVFDMCTLKRDSAIFFLKQHCESITHMKNVARRRGDQVSVDLQPDLLECLGLSLEHESSGALRMMADEVTQWVAWQGPSELRKHNYTLSSNTSSLTLRHDRCLKRTSHLEFGRPVCAECMKLNQKDGIRRTVIRNAVKKFAAEELYARLFESTERMEELKRSRKESAV